MSNTRADKLIRTKRLVAVEAAMGIGLSAHAIGERISEKFNCTTRQVRRDICQIQKRWSEEAKDNAPYRRDQIRTMLTNVYQRALSAGKYSAAVAAAARMIDLDIPKTINVEHSGSVEHDVKDMTSDDKRKRLELLMDVANERRKSKEKAVVH